MGQRLFRDFATVYRLRRVHRQKGACAFKGSTLRLRDAAQTVADWELWSAHDVDGGGASNKELVRRSEDFLHLCAEHRSVGARNGTKARAKAVAAHAKARFSPESAIIRVQAEHSSASAAEQPAERFRGMRSTVHLMLGAPVMLILNRIWDKQTVLLVS